MSVSAAIRPLSRDDLPATKAIIAANDLFPPEMLDGMTAGYLRDGADEVWLVADGDGGVQGLAYCAPERMTDGTWNALLLAVHPAYHGQGIGAALMRELEGRMAARGVRVLLVETSGLDGFARTRAFFEHIGYAKEARIREFYQAGEDKIVYRKSLAA